MLSFYLISNNEGFSNVNFSVDVWDGAAWSVGFFTSNANTFNGEWEQISVILSSLTITGPVQLRFIVDEPATGDFRDDVAIDDITFIEAPACPDPTVLTVANITTTSADLGWTENGTASTWDIESGITGFAPTGTPTVTGTTTNPHNLTLLTANTTYDFYVRADCGSVNGTSAWVGPFTFFTGHCIPAPSSVDGDGITNVTMGTINNTTVAEVGNYGDYSAMVTTAQQSATFAIDVTLETGFTYDLWAWVDWNNDLDFTDAGEEFFLGTSTGNNPTTFSGTITIPLAATLGNHKIRIGGADSGLGNTSPSDPCYTGSFGSFEDYTLNVIAPAADDLGIISIQSAPTGCGLGMETVTIQVKNFGASTQSGFDVVYSLNGTPVTPETTTGNVLSGDTLTHVFTALANMTTPAIYTIDAWSILAADGDNSNDTLNGWMTQHLASSLAFNDSVVIPDNNTVGLSSIICTNGLVNNMLDSCYTLSALVIDSLTHTFNGDLEIWLISPAGDTLEVSSDNGGTTDNYINVTFTDTASTNINGNNPVPGFYHTEELVGLAKFNGTNPNGAWTLLVKDDAGGDIGVLYDWHLEFTDYNFTVNLGTDTNLCSTENVTLNAGAGNYSYVWSTGESTQTIVVDTASLGGSGVYNVNVVVTDTMSGCASNDTIIVNYSVCSGLNEVKNNINLNVYPNPSNGVFTLNVNTTDVNELDIKVMNIQGQVVFVKNNFDNVSTINEQIDLSDNANGIYFITVTSDKGIVTSKIIVQ
jgi:subtilisin-like proprotein convertase family protein